jgi:hypothetical protein
MRATTNGISAVRQFLHVGFADLLVVVVAEHGLEDEPDGHRQPRNGADAGGFEGREGVELTGLAVAEVEGLQGAKQVVLRAHVREVMCEP